MVKGAEMREKWDDYWNRNERTRFTRVSWSKRRIIGILDEYVKDGLVVLDAGCGSGFFSNYFISSGCRVYSLDYSARALGVARRLTRDRSESYLQRDLLDKRLTEEFEHYFDIIFTDGLFEHFPEDSQRNILDGFVTMKKEDGLIATFVPNKFTLWTLLRPLFMPQIKEVPFTLSRLKSLHSRCQILRSGGLNILPVRHSPDKLIGRYFGMLLYIICT